MRIATRGGYPVLTRLSESKVPGVYFVGAPAAFGLGPSMRCIAGTHSVAGRLGQSVARLSTPSFWEMCPPRHLWVRGRVQGVWYRGICAEQARALGVSGWARNLPDGRVEIVAEGAPEALDNLVAWCRHGPPAARVTKVEVHVEEPVGLSGFAVS